jgi:sec-independent protein translocase protein TatC
MPDSIDDNARNDDPASDPSEGAGGSRPSRTGDRPDPANEYENIDWSRQKNEVYDSAQSGAIVGDSDEEEHHEMGFFEHLEELRWRIIKSVIAVAITSSICGYFYRELIEKVLLRPAINAKLKLISTEMAGQFTLAIQVILFSGLILAIPVVIWQVWGFIKPGLYRKERKYASVVAIATVCCFLAGVAFSYFVMIPNSIGFLAGVVFGNIENTIAVNNYFSFILGFILATGVIFEMPMLCYALARFGILTPAFMRQYRRHAAVVILILAAIVTPTPDPFNQLLLAIPLYALYEISILVSGMATRQRAEAVAEYTEEDLRN